MISGRPTGQSFQTAEVVDLYQHRPPYQQTLYDLLVDLAPARDHLLDLGCGHGKIARGLAAQFKQITAIDPSQRMITLGQSLPQGCARNINWVLGLAEHHHTTGPLQMMMN